jgi:hypothetical protein
MKSTLFSLEKSIYPFFPSQLFPCMKGVTDFPPLKIQIEAAVAALYRHHKMLHQDSSHSAISGSSGPNVVIIHPID